MVEFAYLRRVDQLSSESFHRYMMASVLFRQLQSILKARRSKIWKSTVKVVELQLVYQVAAFTTSCF